MSQENVELVRRAWQAYRDHGMDAAVGYFAEDCVIEDLPEMPDRATYMGGEGLRERDRHFAEVWGDYVIEAVDFIDGGRDVVVAIASLHGYGRGSGAPLDTHVGFVYELRDGKIIRDRAFTSKGQALEAVGLSEQDARAES
jgi:ketosteroid isomerase-like protein